MKVPVSTPRRLALLAALVTSACGPATPPPLVCPEGATVELVQYPAERGGGHGERCLRPDGTRHGPSRDFYEDDTLHSLTSWVDNERDGKSTIWYPNGSKQREIEHSRWRAVGVWTTWDEQGKVIEQTDFGRDDANSSAAAAPATPAPEGASEGAQAPAPPPGP